MIFFFFFFISLFGFSLSSFFFNYPVLDMYRMLSFFLPDGFISNEEMDMRSTMRSSWTKMVDHAEEVQDELNEKQRGFQSDLLNDIRMFGEEVSTFR